MFFPGTCHVNPNNTPTPQCTAVPCGGPCSIPFGDSDRGGHCESVSGNCSCVPGTPQPTATSGVPLCVGDCNGDGEVTVDEIISGINEILNGGTSLCPSFNCLDLLAGVDCILEAVNNALNGCPVPSPTATPTISFTYRLGDGSTIAYTAPTPGASPIVEPLSGTFVAAPLPPQCCNVAFALAVTSFEFQSVHFDVSGSVGGISSTTVSPSLDMSLRGTINGQPFDNMIGGAPSPIQGTRPFPPVLDDMVICEAVPLGQSVTCEDIRNGVASGYTLTLFAVPQS